MRISPNEVSFDDIEASDIIYAQTSKFEKSEYYYRAFEDQGPNLFSIRDRQHHSQAKRLVSHAFSRANVIQHESSIYDKALYLMDRIEQRAKERRTIPLFPAFRCMTLDTISEFCFGKSTGALYMNNFESTTFEAIDKANGAVLFVSSAFPSRSLKGRVRDRILRLTFFSSNISHSSGISSSGQTTTKYVPSLMDLLSWRRKPRLACKTCILLAHGPCSKI